MSSSYSSARASCYTVLGALRLHVANKLGIVPAGQWKFCG